MNHFLILFLARVLLWRNAILRASKVKKRGMALVILLGILFVACDYLFFRRIIVYILNLPENLADLLMPQFLMLICLTFFSMLVFSNIISTISAFYLSKDLDFLISAPIHIRVIFISRHILATINSSWMFVLFGVPIFAALGVNSGASAGYYVGLAFTIIPFILLPAGAGVLVTMLLMRFFPSRKTYQFLTVIGLVFVVGLVMLFRFMQPERLLGKNVPTAEIVQFVESLKVPSFTFLPSTWATNALLAGSKSDYWQMASWIGISWCAALVLVAVNILFVSRVYYKGWSIAYSGRSGVSGRVKNVFYDMLEKLLPFLSPPLRAIALKEGRVFWRDPAQWTQIFMLGSLVVVYVFNIKSLPVVTPFLRDFISIMNIGFAGVVLAAVALRFAFAGVSTEAKSFWIIKSSPLNFHRYLLLKFFLYLFPLLALSETLVIASNILLGADKYLMGISISGIFFITIGLTGLGVGLGAIFPVFEHENIAEVGMSTGAVYYMLISLAYVGITVMFGVRPVWVYLSKKFLMVDKGGFEIYICYAIIICLTAVVTLLPMRMGANSLSKMEV
jgi:ABC-2 type transport system permease protein